MNDFFIKNEKTEGEHDRLILSGLLTISSMDEIKSGLLELVSTFSSSLVIVIEEVVEFDLSFIQLLHSFMNLLTIRKISYTVTWVTDEEQTSLLRAAGFSKYL